nr:hypothetical protein Iba_scaffold16408CG0030 [Ipomoea batatas]
MASGFSPIQEATFRIALVIFLYPLASFQPPYHHRQLRQPPTTTPPEKNQSHEEESKVVGHCRCCFAGGSFVASLVRQRRNLLSVPEEASSPELAVNTGEKRGRSEQLCEWLHNSRNSFLQLLALIGQSEWHRGSKFPSTHTMTHLLAVVFQGKKNWDLTLSQRQYLQRVQRDSTVACMVVEQEAPIHQNHHFWDS